MSSPIPRSLLGQLVARGKLLSVSMVRHGNHDQGFELDIPGPMIRPSKASSFQRVNAEMQWMVEGRTA